jgi:hypothetical protein
MKKAISGTTFSRKDVKAAGVVAVYVVAFVMGAALPFITHA